MAKTKKCPDCGEYFQRVKSHQRMTQCGPSNGGKPQEPVPVAGGAGPIIQVAQAIKCDECKRAYDSTAEYNGHLVGCEIDMKKARMEDPTTRDDFAPGDSPGSKIDVGLPTARKVPYTRSDFENSNGCRYTPPITFEHTDENTPIVGIDGVTWDTPAHEVITRPQAVKDILDQVRVTNKGITRQTAYGTQHLLDGHVVTQLGDFVPPNYEQ